MSEEKDSNELLNILLILLGGFYVFLSIMEILSYAGINVFLLPPEVFEALSAVLGSQGLVTITLGIFALVAGIGMFREEEWALGMALVVLAIIVMTSISSLMGAFGSETLFTNWVNYVRIAALVIGVVGFAWLIATRKRYD